MEYAVRFMSKVGEGNKMSFRLWSYEYDGDITEDGENVIEENRVNLFDISRAYRTPTMPHYPSYAGSDDALLTARQIIH